MRKIFKEDLVYKGSLVDWIGSVGLKIRFIYDDISGHIDILDYTEGRKLKLQYRDKITVVPIITFSEARLRNILGIVTRGFKFDIGYNFKSHNRECVILERFYNKGYKSYKCICNLCGQELICTEESLLKSKCSICHDVKIIKGINSFGDYRPDLVKYFKNKDEAYVYSKKSEQKVDVVCPDCGNEHYSKIMLSSLNANSGFRCGVCSNKESVPNKIGRYLLDKFLNGNFIPEYNPKDWTNLGKRRYDFYFEKDGIKYVVELDGALHKKDSPKDGRKLEDTIKNDKEKDEIAKENGCEMIRIDCSKPKEMEVYEAIRLSKLGDMFDFGIIDVKDMLNVIVSSRLKEVCQFKMDNYNMTTSEIGKIFKLDRKTIHDYFKRGDVIFNWFSYDVNHEKSLATKANVETRKNKGLIKPVDVYKNDVFVCRFDSVGELKSNSLEVLGVELKNHISDVLLGKRKHYKGYTFKYYEKEVV